MPAGKSYKSRVDEQIAWIKTVMGDRLAEEDEIVVRQTAQLIVVEQDLFKQVEKLDSFVSATKGGTAPDPIFRLWIETQKNLSTICRTLGLNPVARKETLTSPAKQKQQVSDFEEAVNEL